MLVAPSKGFVFLAMPKAGSTSVEQAFRNYSEMTLQRNPSFKHTRYAAFQRYLQPFLASKGFPRESYEVVCTFREPIDWLSSWWRYRSREEISDPSSPAHRNYVGDISFEEFARAYIDGSEQFAKVGRQSNFVQPRDGQPAVDRIFRHDRMDLLVEYLCEKVGQQVELGTSNVSPERELSLSGDVKGELLAFLELECRIYEQAIGG